MKITEPIESWGGEGSVEGLLYVYSKRTGRPGYTSSLIDAVYETNGEEPVPIIPIIPLENLFSNDSFATRYVHEQWPALITGGRSPQGERNRGPTHYDILVRGRLAGDPRFLMGIVKEAGLFRHLNELEAVHLTMGSVTIGNGLVTIESDFTPPPLAEEVYALFSQAGKELELS